MTMALGSRAAKLMAENVQEVDEHVVELQLSLAHL
jgi:hypothetical protein